RAGPIAGGTQVTITGVNVNGATAVSFGGVPAASFSVGSATSITAVTPAHAAGVVDIRIVTPGGVASGVSLFTYVGSARPRIVSIVPNSGPTAGGTTVTISGSNFAETTDVLFDNSPAQSFAVLNPNTIKAITPAHKTGSVNVLVMAAAGKALRR